MRPHSPSNPSSSAKANSAATEYQNLGFARVDTGRLARKGFAEVIYGEGKSLEQISSIAQVLAQQGETLLITRLDAAFFPKLRRQLPALRYHALAHCAYIADNGLGQRLALKILGRGHTAPDFQPAPLRRSKASQDEKGEPSTDVLVISGGTVDWPTAEEAALTAALMGCRVERMADVGVAGLHRLLDQAHRLRQASALIVAAGMDAALASVVAGLTPRPVIGLPTPVGYGHGGAGQGALMAMLQSCAPGLTVVNIGNGFGAGYAAAQIALSRGG